MITLEQLAAKITEATQIDVRIQGDSQFAVEKIATIESATDSQISFLANSKYKKHLETCNAGAMIISDNDVDAWQQNALVMKNPYAGFAIAAQVLDTTPAQADGIHASASVSPQSSIGKNVKVGANAVIEAGAVLEDNSEIGAGCFIGQGTIVGSGSQLWPNVTIYHGVTLGQQCVIHSNTVIGADGFGYAPHQVDGNQHWLKIPQLGGVTIGDFTQIGASTTIDRGAIEDTKIGSHVILDNQIQLGHNVEIGSYTAIAAATNIAGSTKVGENVTIGGACAINGHITICDRAFITGRTFVMNSIKEPGVYSSGMPASSNKDWRNNTARYRKLTELFNRVKKLENHVDGKNS